MRYSETAVFFVSSLLFCCVPKIKDVTVLSDDRSTLYFSQNAPRHTYLGSAVRIDPVTREVTKHDLLADSTEWAKCGLQGAAIKAEVEALPQRVESLQRSLESPDRALFWRRAISDATFLDCAAPAEARAKSAAILFADLSASDQERMRVFAAQQCSGSIQFSTSRRAYISYAATSAGAAIQATVPASISAGIEANMKTLRFSLEATVLQVSLRPDIQACLERFAAEKGMTSLVDSLSIGARSVFEIDTSGVKLEGVAGDPSVVRATGRITFASIDANVAQNGSFLVPPRLTEYLDSLTVERGMLLSSQLMESVKRTDIIAGHIKSIRPWSCSDQILASQRADLQFDQRLAALCAGSFGGGVSFAHCSSDGVREFVGIRADDGKGLMWGPKGVQWEIRPGWYKNKTDDLHGYWFYNEHRALAAQGAMATSTVGLFWCDDRACIGKANFNPEDHELFSVECAPAADGTPLGPFRMKFSRGGYVTIGSARASVIADRTGASILHPIFRQ
jgi:hypothetical protein